MGRIAKSTEQKREQGTLKKSRVLPNEMSVEVLNKVPKPPEDLTDEGKIEWEILTNELFRLGILATIDLPLIHAYCQEMSIYFSSKKACKNAMVIKSPSGYPMPNPHIGIANKALVNAHKIGLTLGITPAARTRISTPPKPEEDGWDKLLAAKKTRLANIRPLKKTGPKKEKKVAVLPKQKTAKPKK